MYQSDATDGGKQNRANDGDSHSRLQQISAENQSGKRHGEQVGVGHALPDGFPELELHDPGSSIGGGLMDRDRVGHHRGHVRHSVADSIGNAIGDSAEASSDVQVPSAQAMADALKANDPALLDQAIKALPTDEAGLKKIADDMNQKQFDGKNYASVEIGADGKPKLVLDSRVQPFEDRIVITPGDPSATKSTETVNGFIPTAPQQISTKEAVERMSQNIAFENQQGH